MNAIGGRIVRKERKWEFPACWLASTTSGMTRRRTNMNAAMSVTAILHPSPAGTGLGPL